MVRVLRLFTPASLADRMLKAIGGHGLFLGVWPSPLCLAVFHKGSLLIVSEWRRFDFSKAKKMEPSPKVTTNATAIKATMYEITIISSPPWLQWRF
jgi:hypothetical protein